MRIPKQLVAVSLMLISAFVVVFDAVLVRYMSDEIHPFTILFFRNLFSLLILLPLLPKADLRLSAKGLWPVHAVRAVVKLLALAASFWAITLLPLSVVAAIGFTSPLFATLGSVFFLGEKLRIFRIAALIVGFVGVLVVLRPTQVPIGLGAILVLVSAIGLAATIVLMKYSSARDHAPRIVYLNLVLTVPLAALLCLPFWTWPSPTHLLLLVVQGGGGLLAQLSIARAMRMADATLLVPVEFVRLPLAVLVGYFLFAERIEPTVLIGGAVIFAGLILLLADGRSAKLTTLDS